MCHVPHIYECIQSAESEQVSFSKTIHSLLSRILQVLVIKSNVVFICNFRFHLMIRSVHRKKCKRGCVTNFKNASAKKKWIKW